MVTMAALTMASANVTNLKIHCDSNVTTNNHKRKRSLVQAV